MLALYVHYALYQSVNAYIRGFWRCSFLTEGHDQSLRVWDELRVKIPRFCFYTHSNYLRIFLFRDLQDKIGDRNMKAKIVAIILLFLTFSSVAQNLTLAELQKLCTSSWDVGNKTLINKGWEYHDSERDYTHGCATITYAYDKDIYDSERASAWFYFYTNGSKVEQVVYSATETAYKNINSSLTANGYKQIDNEIGNKRITTTYSSKSFILTIKTTTQERAYGGGTFAHHLIYVVRKGGLYDEDNGDKVDYYYDGSTVKRRYTLKDGKINGKVTEYFMDGSIESVSNWNNGVLNGTFTTYYANGKTKITGSIVNDKRNGKFVEYDEDGKITSSGTYLNDKKNGVFTEYSEDGEKGVITYKNGKIEGKYTLYHLNGKTKITGCIINGKKNGLFVEYDEEGRKTYEYNRKDDELNGKYIEYDYDDEGNLFGQLSGQYKEGEKDGRWETKVMSGGQLKTLKFSTYSDGILNGDAREWTGGDSVIFCSYKDGQLDGKYQVKASFMNLFFSPTDDKNSYMTITDGNYSEGNKSGHWEHNNLMGQTTSEGYYIDDKKEGEWKYYEPDFVSEDEIISKGGVVHDLGTGEDKVYDEAVGGIKFVMKLKYIKTYKYGSLHGKLVAFRIPRFGTDSIDYICHYYSGQKHGEYEKHNSLGLIVEQGGYYYGKQNGDWKEDSAMVYKLSGRYSNGVRDGVWSYYDYYNPTKLLKKCAYQNGKKDGTWEFYDKQTGLITQTLNYKQDKLSGRQTKYVNNQIGIVDEYFNGKVIGETIYENGNPKIKYLTDYGTKIEVKEYKDDVEIITDYTTSYVDFYKVKLFQYQSAVNGHCNKNGNYIIKDNKNRMLISGQYESGRRAKFWSYYFYEQNIKCIESFDSRNEPLVFYNNDTGNPYTGQFKNKAIVSGKSLNAIYNIKRGHIQKAIYTDPSTGAVVLKEKCKNGITKDGKRMEIYVPYR